MDLLRKIDLSDDAGDEDAGDEEITAVSGAAAALP